MSEYSSPVSGSLPRPPPLPPRRMPASTDKLAQCDVASQETVGVDRPEDDLSEQRLREVYDDEEIDRFLNLFSAVRRLVCCNIIELRASC